MVRRVLCKTAFLCVCLLILSVSLAHSAESRAVREANEWKKVIAAAKKEGKLVINGNPSGEWRKSLVDMFREEYPDITVEYTGINGRDFWSRIEQERKFGQYLWDLRLGGIESIYSSPVYKGFLAPVRPLLLPDIADDSKWMGGVENLFYDKEKKYMPAYTITIQRTTAVNRDFIKESEIRSSEQILDPKFKGKIIMQTPTGGVSFAALANLAFMYGESFIRELLSKQNVVFTDDKRQEAEWVVRGRYPIAVGFDNADLVPFIRQGLGKNVITLEDKIIPVATETSGINLFKDAPHPNASIVYINWLLSKNTQMKLSNNVHANSLRTDVPPAVKELAVDPANMSLYRRFSAEENTQMNMRYLPLFKEYIKK